MGLALSKLAYTDVFMKSITSEGGSLHFFIMFFREVDGGEVKEWMFIFHM